MRLIFLFFFFFNFVFSQNPKIEVKINSITQTEISASKVEYHIHYQIENKTTNELSFFLIPNALIANTASSLTLYPVYKIYQNGVFDDMDGPFFEYETDLELEFAKIDDKTSTVAVSIIKQFQKKYEMEVAEYYKKYQEFNGASSDINWIYQRQKLLNSIVFLQPSETKQFVIKTLWNKNRHIKNDDLEYYLDENNNIEIQLILELKTKLFKDKLSKEDLEKIIANPNFIEGEFKSNRMNIHFND